MSMLKRAIVRIAPIVADIAQSIIAGFGGGNGDPAVLHESKKPARRPRGTR
jgi:hypothetical protein